MEQVTLNLTSLFVQDGLVLLFRKQPFLGFTGVYQKVENTKVTDKYALLMSEVIDILV